MTDHPHLRRCAYPGCCRWALFAHDTCGVHAGRLPGKRPRRPARPVAAPGAADQIAWGACDPVTLLRDSLHRFYAIRAGYRRAHRDDELRGLRDFARTAVELARTQPEVSARDEIEAFLDTIAEQVLAEGAARGAAEAGSGAS